MDRYPIPTRETRTEITVVNPRFIATAAPVFSVDEAKTYINRIQKEIGAIPKMFDAAGELWYACES